jgi:PKD repeat protein
MISSFKNLTFSKFLLASFAALALTGCLPVPIFEVTPSTARAGTELSFDASGSVVSNTPKDNVAVGWAWEFGDGETARGETVTHTYEKAGTYTIKLTVTDSAGRQASVEEELVVKEALVVDDTETSEDTDETEETEESEESSSSSSSTTAATK